MKSLTLTAKAVRFGILAAATTSIAFTGVVSAEELDEDKVERIAVTGSRIKQVDMETVSPITVLTAADIAMSGEKTVADVLNNSAINAFGSWRGMSGYGGGGAATSTINMRGLGSQATLVLLDGRRMPGTSSSSGNTADTSQIPIAIVERIEILRDGASAVYGSDAIAGVINIITKKEYEGFQVDFSTEQPSIDGGEANRFSIATGFSTDKGNISFTYEYYDTAAVMDNEIWKTQDPDYDGFSGFSSVPNGYYNTGTQSLDEDGALEFNDDGDPIYDYAFYSNSEMCDQTINVVNRTDGANNGRCLYSYGEVTKLFGDLTRNSFMTNFTYEITDNIQFRGRGTASLSETNTRYAATPVSTNYPVMSADNQYNPTGVDMTVYMRSVQIGERDTLNETNTYDILGGFIGYSEIGNGVDWEVNMQHAGSTTNTFNYNLINDNIIQSELDSGEYDIFNTTGMSYEDWELQMAELYGAAGHTGVYQGKFDSTQFDALASTLIMEDGDFSVAIVGGVEYEMINFKQTSDPESAAGIISGGSGGDDVDADRTRQSAYTEIMIGLPASVEISAALRYDRYEQEGSLSGAEGVVTNSSTFDAVVPKIGITWRPVESLLLRASFGESFRAPNMSEMFSSQSLSFVSSVDSVWCDANTDTTYCSTGNQHKTWFGGNPNLDAEEGESLTLGGVWNISDDWSMELSYYSITYDNKIDSVSVADIILDEKVNGSSEFVTRGPDGKIEYVETGYVNMASVETSGFDFATNYHIETGYGDFDLKLDLTHILAFEEQTDSESEVIDYSGVQDYPDWRGNFAAAWYYDDFSAAWTTIYISSQSAQYYRDLSSSYDTYIDTPSYFKHNFQVSYAHDWNGSVTVGVNNLFDKTAPVWEDYPGYRDVNTGLYDVLGRTFYLRLSQKF